MANEYADYTIITTYNCNWDCDYCVIDTHKRNKETPIRKEDLIAKINSIPAGSTVSLSGGEPGLVDPKTMDYVFTELVNKNCTIDIFTNGLFLSRYADKYLHLDNIDEVLYHCVEKLTDDIEFPDYPQDKITYLIVITNTNFQLVDEFLGKYPHITFKIACNQKYGQEQKRTDAFKVFMKHRHHIDQESWNTLFSYSCDCNVV